MKYIKTINPANGKQLNQYAVHSKDEAYGIISEVAAAQKRYAASSIKYRADLLIKLAGILRTDANKYAGLMTDEMGKPITQSLAEVEKCAWLCDYYAENGEGFLQDKLVSTSATKSFVSFRPLGISLAIMPWNFPFWQVFRFAVPAVLAGNGALLKHASNVTGCSLMIEGIFKQAGFPENLFRSIVYPASAMEDIIGHPAVKTVSLTGSTPAGKSVASIAGKYLKKCVLELGGSDPYIVLNDADITETVSACTKGRLINGGQSCIAAKRFLVEEKIYNDFKEVLIKEFSGYSYGDPSKESTFVGPLAKAEFVNELEDICNRAEKAGDKKIFAAETISETDCYFAPAVYESFSPDSPLMREETFGPVAVLFKVKNIQEALEIANGTSFGLGAAIFSKNTAYAEEIAKEQIEAGSVFVNDFVKSDPRLPFGGINESGYGRELSEFGLLEFTNIKTIYIK